MNRRGFLSRAFFATVAFLGLSSITEAFPSKIDMLRWDGPMSNQPVAIGWWDMIPGDIVSPNGKDMWQIETLPYFNKRGEECIKLSHQWTRS